MLASAEEQLLTQNGCDVDVDVDHVMCVDLTRGPVKIDQADICILN